LDDGVVLRVYVVSPLPAVRAGLRALVGEADDLVVAGEASSVEALVRDPARAGAAIDVVVVDAAPGLDGADLVWPEGEGERPALVVLGPVTGDERLAVELAGRGWAYLPRDAGGEQLVAAIRAAGSGLVALDPVLGAHLLGRPEAGAAGALPAPDGVESELTVREREVLGLVAEGLANKAIARRLGISEHTVKFHVAAILSKLGAGSRTEAVRLGAQRGLVAL
jgi:two-component system nitrate/nitrite response regulator NarL